MQLHWTFPFVGERGRSPPRPTVKLPGCRPRSSLYARRRAGNREDNVGAALGASGRPRFATASPLDRAQRRGRSVMPPATRWAPHRVVLGRARPSPRALRRPALRRPLPAPDVHRARRRAGRRPRAAVCPVAGACVGDHRDPSQASCPGCRPSHRGGPLTPHGGRRLLLPDSANGASPPSPSRSARSSSTRWRAPVPGGGRSPGRPPGYLSEVVRDCGRPLPSGAVAGSRPAWQCAAQTPAAEPDRPRLLQL